MLKEVEILYMRS